jgi:predicted nucleic acid-binding protein
VRGLLLDTSVWIAREQGRPLADPPGEAETYTSVVVLGELAAGVLAAEDLATRSRRLATLNDARDHAEPLPVDEEVSWCWSQLALLVADERPRVAPNDLWIAATALAHDLAVCTQDAGFERLPGVEVVLV